MPSTSVLTRLPISATPRAVTEEDVERLMELLFYHGGSNGIAVARRITLKNAERICQQTWGLPAIGVLIVRAEDLDRLARRAERTPRTAA